MKDLLGMALRDFMNGEYSEDPLTETTISEPEEFPIDYFLRPFNEMPGLEQRALELSKGKVLDVGCGAGSHALHLQQTPGIEVTAVDLSPGSIEIARKRGVTNALQGNVFDLDLKGFDTILLLMNGSGILGPYGEASENLKKLAGMLSPGGQILIDSSDIIYMYDEDEDGGKWVPGDRYYGELTFTVHYKGETESFPWIYLDFNTLSSFAEDAGLQCELVMEGEHYDYLARITIEQ